MRAILVSIVVATGSVAIRSNTMPPPPPNHYPQTVKTTYITPATTSPALKDVQTWWTDEDSNTTRLDYASPTPTGVLWNGTTTCVDGVSNATINGDCRPFGSCQFGGLGGQWIGNGRFVDPVYIGRKTLPAVQLPPSGVPNPELLNYSGAVECDLWQGTGDNSSFSICVDINNANVPIEVRQDSEFGTSYRALSMILPQTQHIPLGACAAPPFSCPLGPTVNMTVWRLHNSNDYNLGNKNVADLVGDVAFICPSLAPPAEGNTKSSSELKPIFSAFEITVNTTWSEYALCNPTNYHNDSDYRCDGGVGQPFQVGREAADANGTKHSGQCTKTKPHVGQWFSLLKTAENRPEGWTYRRRIKSVDYRKCIKANQTLVAACKEFPASLSAVQILKKAFDSCADVPPSELK